MALAGSVTSAAVAGAATNGSAGGGTASSSWSTCTLDRHTDVANDMIVRNNGSQPMCMSSDGGDDFTVTQSSVNKNWANFPNIYTGCELDGDTGPQLCSPDHATPVQLSSIHSDTSSVSYYYPQQGFSGNSAYDIWFNKAGGAPVGRDNGAEVMIWLGSHGIGNPIYDRKVEIDGIWWGYKTWRATESGASWNYVRYWRLSNQTPGSAATLNLVPFFQDAENAGTLSSSWYLTGTEYGFETCSGGAGLQVKNFTDSINGAG
ncbi:MAG: hypothetical protein J2P25_08470 [Nocardiopsaceae bacterium]|nr:hypothetical protein [Nocardiopsaceae bacterium]